MASLNLTIEIDELSPKVTLEDIAVFFSYCGTVDSIQLQRSIDKTGIAYVTFRQPYAYRTALLLNGAVIIDNPIRVLPYQDSTVVPVIDLKYEIRVLFLSLHNKFMP
ncbi:hypothetical protein AgCh_001731 [Apium graveolens]